MLPVNAFHSFFHLKQQSCEFLMHVGHMFALTLKRHLTPLKDPSLHAINFT